MPPSPRSTRSAATEMVRLRVRGADGKTREVNMERRELVRRAMGAAVARQTLNLVRQHHVTEAGRRVILEPQWEQPYADPSPDQRMIAPAQRGKTLKELIRTFAELSLGLSVGWVMPKENKVQELVHGKLDPTVKNTPLYAELQAESGGNDTVRFKTFGPYAKLYIVTANSATELTSFSADSMKIDERDFCNRNNLPAYPARMNASEYKLTSEISTPTVEGTRARIGQKGADNIHTEFLAGDQFRYFSTCPHCGLQQILDWYDNVVEVRRDESGRITSFDVRDKEWSPGGSKDLSVTCSNPKCARPFDRLAPGLWVPQNPGARVRSYWIEALNLVMGPTLAQMLDTFTKAIGNPTKLQAFHNMDLGRPFAGGMMRFTTDLFEKCSDLDHHLTNVSEGPCTIGIDVNRPWLDIHVSRWIRGRQVKIWCGKIAGGEDEVVNLIKRFHVVGGIIDTHPETKFAMQLQQVALEKCRCHLIRCKYATNEQSKEIVISEAGDNPELDPPRLITVDRTVAVDSLYESMLCRKVVWFSEWRAAIDGALLEEFSNPVRKFIENEATGRQRPVWVGDPDHQMHAAVYDLYAGRLCGLQANVDLSEIGPMITQIAHRSPDAGPRTATGGFNDSLMIFRG